MGGWVKDHLLDTLRIVDPSPLSDLRTTILNGKYEEFQNQVTALLQKRIALSCTPSHEGKVYQTLCFMLFFSILAEYDIKMEQDSIAAHPPSSELPALLLEIRSVSRSFKSGDKKSFKGPERIKKEMETVMIEALAQLARLEDRRYRESVPLHVKEVHEFGLAFCGRICAAAGRTLQRDDKNVWTQIGVVSGGIVDVRGDADIMMGTEDDGDA